MNHHLISTRLVAIVVIIYLMVPILNTFAKAVDDISGNSVNELWNTLQEFQYSKDLYDYLNENDWINSNVTFKDFDYILVLTDQLCSFYDDVEPSLILAQIAVESRFDIYADNGTAHGLMQLIPIYHEGRMKQFVEEDHIFTLDDFYDPRLNIVTGIDYMSELLNMTLDDIPYSLMCYNEGPYNATKHYVENGHTSFYAQEVMKLSVEIERYLSEGR